MLVLLALGVLGPERGASGIDPADATPPTTVAEFDGGLGTNGWYTSPVIVTLRATDGESGVATTSFQVDGLGWRTYDGPFIVSDEGSHTIEFFSVDVAGNQEPVRSEPVGIDTVPPTSAHGLLGTLGGSGWYVSSVTATLTADDGTSGVDRIDYRLDGGPWRSYSGPFGIGDGTRLLEYHAIDRAGLAEAARAVTVRVDSAGPTCSAALAGISGDNGWWRSAVSLSLTCSDATSGLARIEFRIDGGAWTEYTGPTALPLADGRHTVDHRSTDVAGNTEPIRSLSVAIDTGPPTLTVAAPMDGTWHNASDVIARWSATDATAGLDRFEIFVDGAAPTITTDMEMVLRGLVEGTHAVRVVAYDRAGNSAQVRHTFDVDTVPPAITVSAPANGAVIGAPTVRVEASASDRSSVLQCVVTLDGREPEPVTLPGSIDLRAVSEGNHVVEVACTDAAGNRATRSVGFAVVLDPLDPAGPNAIWIYSSLAAIPIAVLLIVLGLRRRRKSGPAADREDRQPP